MKRLRAPLILIAQAVLLAFVGLTVAVSAVVYAWFALCWFMFEKVRKLFTHE